MEQEKKGMDYVKDLGDRITAEGDWIVANFLQQWWNAANADNKMCSPMKHPVTDVLYIEFFNRFKRIMKLYREMRGIHRCVKCDYPLSYTDNWCAKCERTQTSKAEVEQAAH